MTPRLMLALAILAAPLPAAAQMMGMGSGGLGSMSGLGRAERPQAERPREAPPALPGIAARRQAAPIPAEVNPLNMNPNDALFDGIARGDMATIRDAINRGADVNARNRLGLTALDAAVDQGRPEITFYLLSVRGIAGNPSAPDQPDPPARNARPMREPPAARNARNRAAPEQAAEAETPARAAPQQAAAVRTPTLWAGNGGAPQPEIGFLGFDAGRPAGASAPASAPVRRASAERGWSP
jgi:hypothetical protein